MNFQTLGDLVEITSGFAFKSAKFNSSGLGLPLIRIRDVLDGQSETYYDGDYDEAYLINKGDALIGMDGQFNLACWKGGDALLNQRVCKISSNDKSLDQRYLLNFLPIALKIIEDKTPFVTVKHLSVKDIKSIQVPLPPLTEQRHIAAILDKAEALRSKRREAIAKLDQLLQSVFLEMFGDPVTNPKKWPLQELGDLCDVRDGTHESPKYVEDGFPLVTSKNLKSGKVALEDVSYISKEDFDNINKRSKVDIGDILMPMIGTIGNPVLVEDDPKYSIKNIALIKFTNHNISNTYILQILKSNYFDFITRNKNRGGTQKFLSLGDIRKIPIPTPLLSEQKNSKINFKKLIQFEQK